MRGQSDERKELLPLVRLGVVSSIFSGFDIVKFDIGPFDIWPFLQHSTLGRSTFGLLTFDNLP
jgi:hypothetical protein